jgi:hypothetical protein
MVVDNKHRLEDLGIQQREGFPGLHQEASEDPQAQDLQVHHKPEDLQVQVALHQVGEGSQVVSLKCSPSLWLPPNPSRILNSKGSRVPRGNSDKKSKP